MTARTAHRPGGTAPYGASPALAAVPLALAGLYAVHVPAGAMTRVYYCEPRTGRCSCGAGAAVPTGKDADSCPHIAAACALSAPANPAPPVLEDAA